MTRAGIAGRRTAQGRIDDHLYEYAAKAATACPPGAISIAGVARRLNVIEDDVARAIERLVKRNRLRRFGIGTWEAVL